MHQMGFAQADAAVQEQRIEQHAIGLGNASSGGVGELVGLADNELIKGESAL